jgi:hypothetical protein
LITPRDQVHTMEIDHIFICVKTGAPEAEALKEFGLNEGSPNRHPGQGTANRKFFFQNAFIELLWLDDALEAQSEVTKPTLLYERLTSKDDQTSPFGFCFRPADASEKRVPFTSWAYKPSYLPSRLEINIADGAPLSEPMWFFLSYGSRPDTTQNERRQPLIHQAGFMEITSVCVTLPKAEKLSEPATCAANSHCLEIVAGAGNLLEIGFNNETRGCSHDFRPILPMVFRW